MITERTYIAPAFWVSALIYADESSFDHPECPPDAEKRFRQWCKKYPTRARRTVDAQEIGEETEPFYRQARYTYHVVRQPHARQWIDLGSDVNWREHGGLWGRRLDDTTWETVEFFSGDEIAADFQFKYCAKVAEQSLENPDLADAVAHLDAWESDCSDAEKIAALQRYSSNWAETYYTCGNNAAKVLADAKARRNLHVDLRPFFGGGK